MKFYLKGEMELYLDLHNGYFYDYRHDPSVAIRGVRIKSGLSTPVVIKFLPGQVVTGSLRMVVKSSDGTNLAYFDERVSGEACEVVVDFATQEIRDLLLIGEIVGVMEVMVEPDVEEGQEMVQYKSRSLALFIEESVFTDDDLPSHLLPQWQLIYDNMVTAAAYVEAVADGFGVRVGDVRSGSEPEVIVRDGITPGDHVLDFVLPKGDVGQQGAQGEKGDQGDVGPQGGSPYPGPNGNWFNDLGDTGVPVHLDVDLSHLVPKTELQKTLEGYAKPSELTDDEFTLLPSKDANGIYFIR